MSAMYPGSSHCVPAGPSTCANWRDTNTTFRAGQPGVGRRAIGELHEVLREFERELSVIGILTGEVGSPAKARGYGKGRWSSGDAQTAHGPGAVPRADGTAPKRS